MGICVRACVRIYSVYDRIHMCVNVPAVNTCFKHISPCPYTHMKRTYIMCLFKTITRIQAHSPENNKTKLFLFVFCSFVYLYVLRRNIRKHILLTKTMKITIEAYRFVHTYANFIGKQDRHTHVCIPNLTSAFKYVRLFHRLKCIHSYMCVCMTFNECFFSHSCIEYVSVTLNRIQHRKARHRQFKIIALFHGIQLHLTFLHLFEKFVEKIGCI